MSHLLPPDLAMLQDVIDRNPLVLAPEASVAQAVEAMTQGASCVLVKTEQRLFGILTERDVVKLTAGGMFLSGKPLVDVMTRNLITMSLAELQNPFEVLALFKRHRIRHLPIVDEQENLIGLLTPQALRQTLQSADLLRLRRVADVMTAQVITAPASAKVIALVQLMANHRVSCVVIVEAQPSGAAQSAGTNPHQVPLGIVTERDIVSFQNLQLDLYSLTAEEVMSFPLSCVSPEDTLWESHQVMSRLRVRRLVVAQDGMLAGIITQTSLLSALDPVDLCNTIQVLQTELDRLQDERLHSLEVRSSNLTEQVQETENRFQAIFNNMFQFTGLMKPDGTVIDVNQTALALGGLSLDDVVGRPAWETYWWTISPETQDQFREASARAAQGEFIRYEVDIRGVDGNPLSIDFSIRPLREAQGNVTLLILEGRDISDRKRAEQALQFQVEFDRLVANIANRFISLPSDELDAGIQQSLQDIRKFTKIDSCAVFELSNGQSTLSMIYESVAPDCIPQIDDVEAVPITVFPWGAEKLRRGEVLNIPNVSELPPVAIVDQETLEQYDVTALLAIPLGYQEELFGWLELASYSGEHHWSEDSIRLLSIFASTLTQVLQRQKSEQALQESEQRFQAIFNNTFQFTGLMTLDGTLIEANQTALEFGGIQREEVIGLPFWETHWWTISSETQAQLREASERAAQGEFIRYEVDVLGVGGQVLTIDFSLRPLKNDQGNVVLLIPEGRDVSDRKQAELELRESEQRYASLAKAAPVGICRTDANGHCIYLNERWSSITGLPCCEGKGEGWLQGVHPEDREAVEAEWYQSIQEHRPFRMEFRFLRPDGQVTWVLNQSVAEYDVLGQMMGYVGTMTDVTERVQARLRLQDSEERLRLALAAAKQGLYDLNIQTGDAIVNDDYALMLGYDPDSFQETNANWVERLHPEDSESVAQTYQAYVRGDIPDYSVEFRQRMANGDWKWILSLGKIVEWDEAGNPLRMLGTHTDIDALKQAEQLKSELVVLEDILEATLAGYWDWDLQNNQEYLSPTFKQMLGYAEDELDNAPESWQRLIFEEDLARVEASFEQHIQSKGEVPFYNEVRYRHKNGSVIWVICAGRVIDWDENGEALRMVGCHVDITQRKQAEEQLRSLNQELQRSNKDLEQFAYITSHDLQEPLRAVTAYTNLLLADYGDALTDDNAQKYTGYILDGTQRMRELIRDLLAYSRVGSNDLKRTSLDCNELWEKVLLNLADAIAESQANIQIGPMPLVEGDRTQLLQLFQNLLSNAIKFNEGDPPDITISAVQQVELEPHQQASNITLRQQHHWLFSVQDQGIGIREKYLLRIFEIFRRLHIREQFPGTGIGLAICQRVVERHGGEIWAESQFGEGTIFYFTFPTHEPTALVNK